MALKTETVKVGGKTYEVSQLPLEESEEVLVKIMRLVGSDMTEGDLAGVIGKLEPEDISWLRERLLGQYCAFVNESGHRVPMGRALVNEHFAGHIGRMFNLLGRALMVNYSDFLADLDIEGLTG